MQLLQLHDQQRRGVARELHDGPAQLLSGIVLNLQSLLDREADPVKRAIVAETISFARQCGTDLNAISGSMHPLLLDELGLTPAIHVFANSYRQRTGRMVEVHLPPDLPHLDPALELSVYRIVEDAISYVSNSLRAAPLSIAIRQVGGVLQCEIHAEGANPDPISPDTPITTNILRRVRHLGGKAQFLSTTEGNTVLATVPVSE